MTYDEMNERELLAAIAANLSTLARRVSEASELIAAAAALGKGDPGELLHGIKESLAYRARREKARR